MYAILSKGVAMKSVMELLYELRVDHDLTQAEVGAVLGISQQHYSKYETGEYELPLRHFVSLANYYQVSADYLIGRHHNLELKEEDMVYLTAQYSCGNLLRDVMPQCERPAGCFGICTFVAIKGTEQKCGLNWLPA